MLEKIKEFFAWFAERASFFFALLGSLLIIVGATAGGIAVGTFSLPKLDLLGRVTTITVGAAFVAVGILLSLRATRVAGVRITSPRPGETRGRTFAVEGTFDRLPTSGEIRLFVSSTADRRIWPQGPVVPNRRDKTWRCEANLWHEPRDVADLIIAKIDRPGQILCDYYGRVGTATNQWIPLLELTPDVEEYDRVRVVNGFRPNTN